MDRPISERSIKCPESMMYRVAKNVSGTPTRIHPLYRVNPVYSLFQSAAICLILYGDVPSLGREFDVDAEAFRLLVERVVRLERLVGGFGGTSGLYVQRPPRPGSSGRRGTLMKRGSMEMSCRAEFLER